MGKKRTLAIILLLCVLGGLIACGRKEKEDEYTYTIKLNDNALLSKISCSLHTPCDIMPTHFCISRAAGAKTCAVDQCNSSTLDILEVNTFPVQP